MAGESLDPSGQKVPIHRPHHITFSLSPLMSHKQGDPKEAFNIAPPQPTLQPLPPTLFSDSPLISRFQESCHNLCLNVLTLLATALQIPESAGGSTWFSSRHDQSQGHSGTIFRMLYYPQTKASKSADNSSIRAGAHSDYGSLTLLFRLPGQPGLEILKDNGSWVDVPVGPSSSILSTSPILVNIGDLLSFWTKGMLKSTVHRVTFSGGEERYSMAYFCHPLDDALLEVVPSKVIDDFGDNGATELKSQRERLGLDQNEAEVLTAKQHLDRRLKVTYGLGDN
jgi:isopenicillin N synthase-like dioxygenase